MTILDNLTSDQLIALESMRNKFNNIETDINIMKLNDSCYLRYLKARNYDVEKASKLLIDTIKWRKDFGIDQLHNESNMNCVSKENSSGKMFLRGYDKEGSILLYMRPRCENTHNHENNLKHLVYNLEKACACLEAKGEGIEKWTILIDFQGYSMFNAPPFKTSMETLNILQNHYPERLKRAFCIRPPFIFNAFWTMISPFIDPVTKDKIQMVNDPVNTILEKYVDMRKIEKEIGGMDERKFDSKLYLAADFSIDYLTLLDDKK